MELFRKALQIKEVKASGEVLAAIATLNVVDKDGDITMPGFFGEQDTVMLPAHNWSHVPIGKGRVFEAGDRAIAELQMNLDIPAAKDWHSALMFDLKNGRPLQEWSYGFTILPGGSSMGDNQNQGRRMLRPTPEGGPGAKVHEVSPVLVGAGEGTGTIAAKDHGLKFCEEAKTALATVESLLARAKALADLRAKDGRALSAASRERLQELQSALSKAGSDLAGLLGPDMKTELLREAVRFERICSELHA